MTIMLLFAATAAATAAPALTPPPPAAGEARRVVEWQLSAPPRPGPAAGLSADEADAVMKKYLASIGQPLATETAIQPR